MVDASMTGTEDTDAPVPQDPKLVLAQKKSLLKSAATNKADKSTLEAELKEACFSQDLGPTYEAFCEELGWQKDEAKLQHMKQQNQEKLASLDAAIADAEENLGDIEVRDAYLARADYLCSIGDRAAATEAYKSTLEKTAGVGAKTDMILSMLRQEIAQGDWWAVRDLLRQAKDLSAKGADWERKNRLKVYEALCALATRDFATAAQLFLDSIATFTATELFPYETCIFYTVVTSLVSLERKVLKSKVVDAPEVLTIISSIPHVELLLNSFYSCRYAEFLQAFAALSDVLKADRYLHPHCRYYTREVRKAAYVQFLEAYKSVTLDSMASSFGVSPDFIDAELEEFIVAGHLTAKIDKVAGVVETNRADTKNAQYQATIKQGDVLLNRLQRLAKIIDVE